MGLLTLLFYFLIRIVLPLGVIILAGQLEQRNQLMSGG